MKLYTYQKELVNSKEDRILVNWARATGKDVGLAYYILENKPSRVLVNGLAYGLETLVESFKRMTLEYNYEIEHRHFEITITFNGTGKKIYINYGSTSSSEVYDLTVNYNEYDAYRFKDVKGKYILATTLNVHESKRYIEKSVFDKVLNVDYKEALKENALDVDTIIESAQGTRFYEQYALLDKKPSDEMSFNTFKEKALQKLQKQFLSIPDSKDTVLTRKNIIEMIKDLQQLN